MKKILTSMAILSVGMFPAAYAQLQPGHGTTAEYASVIGATSDSVAGKVPGRKFPARMQNPDGTPPTGIMRKDVTANPEPDLKMWGAVGYADHEESTGMNATEDSI